MVWQSAAGVRVDEQGAPEGRGMEEEAVCGQLFFCKSAQPGVYAWIGKASGVHGKKLLKVENTIIILMSGNSQLASQCLGHLADGTEFWVAVF